VNHYQSIEIHLDDIKTEDDKVSGGDCCNARRIQYVSATQQPERK